MGNKKWDIYTRRCKRCDEFYKTVYKLGKICNKCNTQKYTNSQEEVIKNTEQHILESLASGSKRLKDLVNLIPKTSTTISRYLGTMVRGKQIKKVITPRVRIMRGRTNKSLKHTETKYLLYHAEIEPIYTSNRNP